MAWEWARQGASYPLPTECPQPNAALASDGEQPTLRLLPTPDAGRSALYPSWGQSPALRSNCSHALHEPGRGACRCPTGEQKHSRRARGTLPGIRRASLRCETGCAHGRSGRRPAACPGWVAPVAAYRLVDHPAMRGAELRSGHPRAPRERRRAPAGVLLGPAPPVSA
jgi:hypothetical protein